MEGIHVHAENRIYKVYGQGPATIVAQIYAHARALFSLWLLSIIPFIIVYINTYNVQYGITVSFFVVLIEIGKHLAFYDESPRAFLVLEYHLNEDEPRRGTLPRNESENSVSESNEPSESAEDEGEEETIETACEGDGYVEEGDVTPTEGEGDVTPTEEDNAPETLESPHETNESTESTEKNETQSEPIEKED